MQTAAMRLHTTTTGDGEHHVGLVHGLGADGATWQPLVDRMTATGRYTVTTVDLRGHGRSDRADRYRLDDFADDLVGALPTGLHSVVGHSLGGAVLVRAVGRLRPEQAVYLDPGFHLALPTTGLVGRLFWAVPQLTLGIAGLLQARKSAAARAGYTPAVRQALADARKRFDGGMATGVFREVAHTPLPIAPPEVPSVVVLSEDAPAVVPDAVAGGLERAGWEIRRIPGIHHDMQLEDAARTLEAVADVL